MSDLPTALEVAMRRETRAPKPRMLETWWVYLEPNGQFSISSIGADRCELFGPRRGLG